MYPRPLPLSLTPQSTLCRLWLSLLISISPTLSLSVTEPDDGDDGGGSDDDDEYTSIYVTMIIIFSILFLVVICCLLYRIYKKRQEESGRVRGVKSSNGDGGDGGGSKGQSAEHGDKEHLGQPEQVKFRGSMSSVEHRHERIPSKPVVIAITTPKGTRHVADAFGDYEGDESADPDLPGIHEDAEEEYTAKGSARTQAAPQKTEMADRQNIHSESAEDERV